MLKTSQASEHLCQSGIRAASTECGKIGGINLGQGICDIPTPEIIKQAAVNAIEQEKNVYSACEGVFNLRQAIANKIQTFNKIPVHAETEIVVTHGSTGAFVCATMSLFNPGDEVILFEPFYGYHKSILELYQVNVKSVPIHLQDLSFQIDDLEKAITPKTRAIIICTPCNPCGKVFSEHELLAIGAIAEQYDLAVITDEIYEYITYPGYNHISFAGLKNFKDRTITISGFSKTYNMTGWRLGYASGPAHVIAKMALVQDLLYVCPSTPLQHAAIDAFKLQESYYQTMCQSYLEKRDYTVRELREIGFEVTVPQGAYYIMADFSSMGVKDDAIMTRMLLEQAKVAVVPGRSFYVNPDKGQHVLRFCYALSKEKVAQGLKQIKQGLVLCAS
ncbi:pyridoxal phosphate-dependent aminotransferase [Legionella waltersii]|uniref:Aminotransferase n=1 Tax=Legionella waltersii TaxID=66969 RepID=A0A0W1A763_9GAMM|nr:pyridoxal phosphate-dependent aminotransferase [Legionella waltersii]KTD77156.1 aspartate aminotransferase [Legionella waltersii]SNV11421.1 aspartate aminotransferase [Legionella waltersii]